MKNYFIYLFIIISAYQLNAQKTITKTTLTYKQQEEVKTLFTYYFNELNKEELDFNKIIGFTYPELFTLISKEQMIDLLKKSFNNEIMSITFDKMNFDEIKQSFTFLDILYTKVTYESVMSFHFIKSKDQTESDFNDYVNLMLSTYKNQFKESEVTKKGHNISIASNKIIIAIHAKNLDKPCYLLEFIEDNKDYYSMFLPVEVAKHISTNFK